MEGSGKPPRVVVITRPTWYAELLARHATHQQVRFFLESRGQSLDVIAEQHEQFEAALAAVLHAVPPEWRMSRVSRADLDRFLFEPDDLVVALGQDGLVANTAKYLDGQPVLGVNPSPAFYDGVLVRLSPDQVAGAVAAAGAGAVACEERTMVEARLEDGQRLLAVNEVFLGHCTHQSARYRIRWNELEELQSSSGVIVSSGTGATGWARSVHTQRRSELELPRPEDPRVTFFTREAWPSATTGAELVEGHVDAEQPLAITSRMNDGGVIFGDGMEQDRLEFGWGRRAEIGVAREKLHLVVA